MLDRSQPRSALERQLYGATGLTLLVLVYLLPGAIGHDPWRGADIEHFATVHALLQGEWLLLPTVAGEPVQGFGPFHYWLSALFATVLGWLIPVHDAARLATPFAAAMATLWITRTAARLYGRHTRAAAALLTIGTLGLAVHVHENQPMITLMALQGMTLAGLALIPTQPLKGSIQAGLGVALAFLTAGFAGVLLTLPLLALVAVAVPEVRTPRASGALIVGLSIAVGGSALWPIALGATQAELLDLWWLRAWTDFAGDPMSRGDLPRLAEMLGWFTWPLWPIALWALWRARRQLARLQWLLPLVAAAVAVSWIMLGGSLSAEAMLPAVPALTLLAAGGVPTMRRGAANAFDWFALMTFGLFALLVWLAWTAQIHEWPPGLARSLARMAPDFVPSGTGLQATIGVIIMLLWAVLVWRLPRSADRSSTNWALGMTMLWCLMVTLLMPWVDYTRNYRPMAESLKLALSQEQAACIATTHLGTTQRAVLDYYLDLRPLKTRDNETHCRYLLVHDDEVIAAPSPEWLPVWRHRHAGGKRLEVFTLYRRD
ncbi:MAG: hypothetical protein LPJ91_10265 [Pseudazoarcus pumilus]|nr:hypothetical protein [Pseudazoarcus pumilus]